MPELVFGALAVAAIVYGQSAAAKLRGRRAYHDYQAGLGETALVPRRRLVLAAAALVVAETAVTCVACSATAAMLLLPGALVIAEAALAGALLLTAVLAAGIWLVIRRGTRARCACFGAASLRPLGAVHLARNLGLLSLMATGLIGALIGGLGPGRPGLAIAVVAVTGGAVVGLLMIHFEGIVFLFAPVDSASMPEQRTVTPASSIVRPQSKAAQPASYDRTVG
jgi:hypothetical protein